MKFQNIIYLYLCFVFILAAADDIIDRQKGKITIEADENHEASFIFDSSSYQDNDYIYFRVKSVENNFIPDEKVKYIYIDSEEETPATGVTFLEKELTGTEKETLENTTVYDIKFFKIQKLASEHSGHNGDYLYIIIKINSGYVEVTNTAKDTSVKRTTAPSDVMNGIVQKYGSTTVDANEYMVVFNVGDFDDDEEMYFQIKAETGSFYWYYIYYEYISSNKGYVDAEAKRSYFSLKTTYETSPEGYHYETHYFTITKRKGEFRGTDGTYLLIYFMVDYGDITITNTEEDEGKLETWVIIVIVVAVVIVIGIIIICCCVRRRRLKAMNANANANGQFGQFVTPTNAVVNPDVPYQQDYVYSNNY